MKQYSYYDAYHRQRKFPMTIRLHRWRSKRGVFLLSFFIALVLVRFFLWEEITEVAGWSRNGWMPISATAGIFSGMWSYEEVNFSCS